VDRRRLLRARRPFAADDAPRRADPRRARRPGRRAHALRGADRGRARGAPRRTAARRRRPRAGAALAPERQPAAARLPPARDWARLELRGPRARARSRTAGLCAPGGLGRPAPGERGRAGARLRLARPGDPAFRSVPARPLVVRSLAGARRRAPAPGGRAARAAGRPSAPELAAGPRAEPGPPAGRA